MERPSPPFSHLRGLSKIFRSPIHAYSRLIVHRPFAKSYNRYITRDIEETFEYITGCHNCCIDDNSEERRRKGFFAAHNCIFLSDEMQGVKSQIKLNWAKTPITFLEIFIQGEKAFTTYLLTENSLNHAKIGSHPLAQSDASSK